MATIVGRGFLNRLCELGIIPSSTRRVVIEAAVDGATMIYVEQYGDKRLFSVEVADFLGAQIVMEEKTNGTAE